MFLWKMSKSRQLTSTFFPIRDFVNPFVRPLVGKRAFQRLFVYVSVFGGGLGGAWVWMGVGCPCPPVCNDIVTPHHWFIFDIFINSKCQLEMKLCSSKVIAYEKTLLGCFWKRENSSENRFKKHLSSNFSCKNFIGLSYVIWPQY